MLSFNLLVAICLTYVVFLFIVAALAERRAEQNKFTFLTSPIVYTLSISVYCTAWTFYGAVGYAARSGLEFLTIYIGPTLVFIGWWWLLRRLVRIGRTQRITSIADLISSRYGKSNLLGVIVTLLAVTASTPYIALQLQSLTLSISVFAGDLDNAVSPALTALFMAMGLALFTVIFGTRNINANEQHHGVVTAIAFEAVVKLVALLAVGVFVVWGVADGPLDIMTRMEQRLPQQESLYSSRWATLIFLSATAIICLPRMFQIVVVENSSERHLAMASWAFPLYLFLMCIFVLPIAVMGLELMPEGANPDLFVLTLPLHFDQQGIAALAFLGGFSSATSMVIVAAIALSTMVSNHIVLPLWLYMTQRRDPESDDVRSVLLRSRRISIAAILALGYLYYIFTGGTTALASIGLIAFVGAAQILPALLFGLFWRQATRLGAIMGIVAGFIIWAYSLFLPSFDGSFILTQSVIDNGLFGLSFLRPYALFGVSIDDPLIHVLFWSMAANAGLIVLVSMVSHPSALERLQALQFIHIFGQRAQGRTSQPIVASEDLFILAQRILGRQEATKLFEKTANEQGVTTGLPEPTGEFIHRLERELSGSVGAATAHAMVGQLAGGEAVSVEELIAVADETAQIMEYSAQLEKKSNELTATAAELRRANQKLTLLSQQKDDFLSQVSHELRTPMTSIRSFSEIIRSDESIDRDRLIHFSSIINEESQRLTRLLDEILDLSFLESGRIKLNLIETTIKEVIDQALSATSVIAEDSGANIIRDERLEAMEIITDRDRLSQVFINLIINSIKYAGEKKTVIEISHNILGEKLNIFVTDNGPGIPLNERQIIFEKFSRLSGKSGSTGVGLGLPISLEIMQHLGGDLQCIAVDKGAKFRLSLPLSATGRAPVSLLSADNAAE